MAAGRGEFFRSFLDGLERKPAQPAPGGRQPGTGRGRAGWKRRKKWQPKAAPSSVSGNGRSPEPKTQKAKANPPEMKISPAKENFIERLPSEILMKICSFLDASALFCISHVSKLFHQLANDDVIWHKIYMSEFGSPTWKPKLADEAVLKVDPVEAGDQSVGDQSAGDQSAGDPSAGDQSAGDQSAGDPSAGDQSAGDPSTGHWKRMYFRTIAGHEMNKWSRELREMSPYTGLPRRTEWVLRKLNVSWELTVCEYSGWKTTLEQSRAYFFETSVIVCWRGSSFPKYHNISNIQLHGVRKETQKSTKAGRPGWCSLISKLDMKTQRGHFIGKDRLITLMHLSPGYIVGIWRGQNSVAFVMVCLHFHKLVEKSLLGSPVCPYLPPVDNSDPEFSLHDYTLHFCLHNTGTEIMSGHFRHISCCTAPRITDGLVELIVINRTNLSHHRSLSGNVKLPWKSAELEGSVENCCIITLTLLDEFQKPLWCVSSPICIKMAKKKLSFDYSGEHYLMEYRDCDGQVKMKLVWLKEQKQFFLISLIVYVSVSKVNKHFSTEYGK